MNKHLKLLFIYYSLLITASCSNDKDIKGDIMAKAKSDPNFAGVVYTVNQKVVWLRGNCPTQKSKDDVEKAVKSIHVINGIQNDIVIAPVTLNTFFTLKQSVDSILASYPGVIASTTPVGLVLSGNAQQDDIKKLMSDVNKLHSADIKNHVNPGFK